ncbi:MAG: hypothetical protein ACYCSW_03810 [bacterium]
MKNKIQKLYIKLAEQFVELLEFPFSGNVFLKTLILALAASAGVLIIGYFKK